MLAGIGQPKNDLELLSSYNAARANFYFDPVYWTLTTAAREISDVGEGTNYLVAFQ